MIFAFISGAKSRCAVLNQAHKILIIGVWGLNTTHLKSQFSSLLPCLAKSASRQHTVRPCTDHGS